MSNFFSFDSGYHYEPVVKQLDQKIIENDLSLLRRKIMESIKQIIDQKDLSRAELAMVARINRPVAGQIHRGSAEKISTDRLLRIARRLGLKAKITFTADSSLSFKSGSILPTLTVGSMLIKVAENIRIFSVFGTCFKIFLGLKQYLIASTFE